MSSDAFRRAGWRRVLPAAGMLALCWTGTGTTIGQAPTTEAPDISDSTRAAMETIRAAKIMPTIRFLASNQLEGREAGERGERVAADYIVSRFEAAGIEPGTKGGFLQRFDLRWRVLGQGAAFELTRRDGEATLRREWEPGRDFFPLSFSEEGEVEASLVFAGFGIDAPEYGWNDYAALGKAGARGKIVVVLRHEPDEEGETRPDRFDGREMTLHASLRQKVRVAAKQGAAGLILVDDPGLHEVTERPSTRWRTLTAAERLLPDDDPVRFGGRPDTRDAETPLGLVAVHASQDILRWLDPQRDWKALQQAMEKDWKPQAVDFAHVRARLVHQVESSYRSATNVIGMLRGSDPELSDEYVLVGGHFDHVGMDDDGADIYNGADDNASGTAAVVALAEAFASLPERPARSVMFVGWAAEEKGLLGSNWFVHHPPVDLDKIVCAVNLDMVGRNDQDKISVVGRTETPDLVQLFDRYSGAVGLTLNDDAGAGASRSDNASLWLAGIPTAGLFSGTHDDYHEPSDTADKVNGAKVERAARLTFLVMNAVAGGSVTPKPLVVPAGPWKPVAPADRIAGAAEGETR